MRWQVFLIALIRIVGPNAINIILVSAPILQLFLRRGAWIVQKRKDILITLCQINAPSIWSLILLIISINFTYIFIYFNNITFYFYCRNSVLWRLMTFLS